jgi:2-polyprenyl-6-methoxyphenol hydroxylase-like FAD-dependent oxidoreductase
MAERADIVIAGGGIAGSVAAAALSRLGFDIVLLEPGMHADRRLGGELLHPLGVAGLAELDLLGPVAAEGAVTLEGFHIWDAASGDVTLSYQDAGSRPALALDHSLLRRVLLDRAAQQPGVALRHGRVVAVENREQGVRVRTATDEGEQEIDCRLLVGADGAQSRVRALAGIAARRHLISSICAVTVPDAALPEQRYGQLFIGGSSATLAYRYGAGRGRVMFDHAGSPSAHQGLSCLVPTSLPPALAAAIGQALDGKQPQRMNTFLVIVFRPRRGRVVLIGDAAGTCHPLTASGMSACIADALSLGNALGRSAGKIDRALNRHVARRYQAQLSRIALASAMHEVMANRAPEFAPIRAGMMRYWQSKSGRSRAVALLSMTESRPRRLFAAMLAAAGHGLFGQSDRAPGLAARCKLAAGLARFLLRYGLGLFGGARLLPGPLGDGRSA